MLSNRSKIKAFVVAAIPLILAKFWQETLYLMSYFLENDLLTPASQILETAKYQPLGVATGYIFTAILVDKIGIRKTLSVGLALMSFIIMFFSQTTSFQMLFAYRFLLGVFIGLIYNCSFGALSIIFEDHELPKKTSLLYMCAFASTMLSPVILRSTSFFFSWRILLLMITALNLITALCVLKFFPEKSKELTATSITEYLKNWAKLLRNSTFLLMAIVSTLCMGGFYGFVCIFSTNLSIVGSNTTAAKFIITDMQFIGRLLLFIVTTWSGYKLTQKNIPQYLQVCLILMMFASFSLLLILNSTGTLFASYYTMKKVLIEASLSKSVIFTLLSNFSGVLFFWLYAALMGIAQPANKAKALSIAGKNLGGAAQAILGFSLSIGEFFFALIATKSWPHGANTFLIIIILAAFFVTLKLNKIRKS